MIDTVAIPRILPRVHRSGFAPARLSWGGWTPAPTLWAEILPSRAANQNRAPRVANRKPDRTGWARVVYVPFFLIGSPWVRTALLGISVVELALIFLQLV